ncbi:MAG: 50S ribosomal protein L18 [Marinobacter alexandrii]|jgi:large subunit ribosomal protein L18|uniref:Large ribosomal subunit protein uL18 n=2 Tax=Pseudomonadota TaxID=1224 RepID=A0ABS0AIW0_9GAMM|nr:50S ribosomal protein L18 [Alloalcanivorax venustensis ISO4]|tara:strand:+ start:7938 stop:8285 length:348 start_codon:yes stop_codon:yes gene_type:complete
MDKKLARLRRAKRTRLNIRESGQIRLSVHRTPRHIYAQITSAAGDRVLVTASTVEKDLREAATGNADAASKVGELIAKRAKEAGIERVAFDRSGFRYHGRIKALADAARENGLEF